MANQLNSGSLDTLKVDEVLLTHVEKTANGGFRAEFVQNINRGGDTTDDVLAMMNASDPRFKRGSKTYNWTKSTITDLETLLNVPGLDIENSEFVAITSKTGKVREVTYLNILNPEYNGQKVSVQITETTEATDWQRDNDTGYKVNPATSEVLTKDGKNIYRNTKLVLGEPTHTYVQHDRVEVKIEEAMTATASMEML
tara:strand:+ start:1844 stop:2437 length:594 start_codon:yes stop_codon:yes gene_type:complete